MTSRRRRAADREIQQEMDWASFTGNAPDADMRRILASRPRTEITVRCQKCGASAVVVTIDQGGRARLTPKACRSHRVDEHGKLHIACRCWAQLQVSRDRLRRADANRGAVTIDA